MPTFHDQRPRRDGAPSARRPAFPACTAVVAIPLLAALLATPLAAREFDRVTRPNPPVARDMKVGTLVRDDSGRLALLDQRNSIGTNSLQFRGADGGLTGRMVPPFFGERRTQLVGNGPDGLLRVLALGYGSGRLEAYRYDGSRAWSAPLGTLTSDYRPIGIDASGSYWGAGATPNPDRAMQVARFSAIGAPQLSVRIESTELTAMDAMAVDRVRQRAFVFGPNSFLFHKPGALYRVDASGAQAKIWSTAANEAPLSMVVMSDGQLVLSTLVLFATDAVHLRRVDADGVEIWSQQLDGVADASALLPTPSGGFDVVVARRSNASSQYACALQERDIGGQLLWERPLENCATTLGRHPLAGVQVFENAAVPGSAQLESFDALGTRRFRIGSSSLGFDFDYQPTYAVDGSVVVPGAASTVLAIDPQGGMRTLVDLHAVPIDSSRLWDTSLTSSGEVFELSGSDYGSDHAYAAIDPAGSVSWRRTEERCPSVSIESNNGRLQAHEQGPVWLQTACGGTRPLARSSGESLWSQPLPLTALYPSYAVDASHLISYGTYAPAPGSGNNAVYRVDLGSQTPTALSGAGSLGLGPVGPTGFGSYIAVDGLHVFGPDGRDRWTLPTATTLTPRAIGPGGQTLLSGSNPSRLELRDEIGRQVATRDASFSIAIDSQFAVDASGTAYAALRQPVDARVAEVAVFRLSAQQTAGDEIDRFPIPAPLGFASISVLPYRDLLLVVVSSQESQTLLRTLRPSDHAVLRTEVLTTTPGCYCRWKVGDDGVLRGVVQDPSGFDSTVAVIALDHLLDPAPPVRLDQSGIGGAWYPPNLPGQGLTLDYFSDSHTLFGAWFVYSTTEENHGRQQRWFSLQAQVPEGASRLSLPIYRNSDGNFAAAPSTQAQQVGMAVIEFSSCRRGSLRWQFDAAAGADLPSAGLYALERLGPTPADCTPADGSAAQAYEGALSGTWYPPAHSGQGLQIFASRAPNPFLFGAWFTYAPAGSALAREQRRHWFSLQDDTFPSDGNFHGTLYESLGGQFGTRAAINTRAVGRYDFRVVDCTHARIEWTFFDTATALDYGGLQGGDDLVRLGSCPR